MKQLQQQQQPIIATSINYNFNHNLAIRNNSAKKLTAKTSISFNHSSHNNKSFKERSKPRTKETITNNSNKVAKSIQVHNKKQQKLQESSHSENKRTIQYVISCCIAAIS